MAIDKNHPLNVGAWLGFINWAIEEKELRQQFEEGTGLVFIKPSRNIIEKMIDQATSVDKSRHQYVKEFVVWATEKLWGDEEYIPDVFYEVFKNNNDNG